LFVNGVEIGACDAESSWSDFVWRRLFGERCRRFGGHVQGSHPSGSFLEEKRAGLGAAPWFECAVSKEICETGVCGIVLRDFKVSNVVAKLLGCLA
jgi:hypothetical protein